MSFQYVSTTPHHHLLRRVYHNMALSHFPNYNRMIIRSSGNISSIRRIFNCSYIILVMSKSKFKINFDFLRGNFIFPGLRISIKLRRFSFFNFITATCDYLVDKRVEIYWQNPLKRTMPYKVSKMYFHRAKNSLN